MQDLIRAANTGSSRACSTNSTLQMSFSALFSFVHFNFIRQIFFTRRRTNGGWVELRHGEEPNPLKIVRNVQTLLHSRSRATDFLKSEVFSLLDMHSGPRLPPNNPRFLEVVLVNSSFTPSFQGGRIVMILCLSSSVQKLQRCNEATVSFHLWSSSGGTNSRNRGRRSERRSQSDS